MSAFLELIPEAIPPALRSLPCVLWRAEPRPGDKPAKVPYQIADPVRRASSTDPASWGTFADAVEAYGALAFRPAHPVGGAVVGIGVVLTRAAGVTCLDLDYVIDPDGHLDVRAATIVERCDSWTETSPSGTGLHVFVRGAIARALKGPEIEVYSDGRYIAITGHRWPGTPDVLRWQQAYLDHLVRLEAEGRARPAPYTGPAMPPPDDLAGALLAKLQAWGVPVVRLKHWSDGFLVELVECPWATDHTTGRGGAAVIMETVADAPLTSLSGDLDAALRQQRGRVPRPRRTPRLRVGRSTVATLAGRGR